MVLSILLIPFNILLGCFYTAPANYYFNADNKEISDEWIMVKNEQGVKTFYRWITKSDGTAFRERKGEVIADCSVEEAIKLIADSESTPKWMVNIEENYVLEYINKDQWYNYTLFDIPWPFNNRDLVSLYQTKNDPLKGNAAISITCKDSHIPLKKGITRLTDYRAVWSLVRQGEQSTFIVLTMSSSSPPAFPRAIQDPVIERIFHGNLVRLKIALEN